MVVASRTIKISGNLPETCLSSTGIQWDSTGLLEVLSLL